MVRNRNGNFGSSVLVHDNYCREAKNPIYLVINIGIGDMDIRSFITSSVGVPSESKKKSSFEPIKIEIIYSESKRVSIDFVNR